MSGRYKTFPEFSLEKGEDSGPAPSSQRHPSVRVSEFYSWLLRVEDGASFLLHCPVIGLASFLTGGAVIPDSLASLFTGWALGKGLLLGEKVALGKSMWAAGRKTLLGRWGPMVVLLSCFFWDEHPCHPSVWFPGEEDSWSWHSPRDATGAPAFDSFQEELKQSLEMSLEILSPLFASLEMRCRTHQTVSTLNLYNSPVWSLWERNQPAGIPEVQPRDCYYCDCGIFIRSFLNIRIFNLSASHSSLSSKDRWWAKLQGQQPLWVFFSFSWWVLLQTISPAWISSSSEVQTAKGL